MSTVFLISPARCSGERAAQLVGSQTSPLGGRLRADGASIGEVFTYLSALYFRGKLTYARAFARRGVYVMAPGRGLVAPDEVIGPRELQAMGEVAIESDAFVTPLRRDAERGRAELTARTRVVLLGSIATGKYVDTLLGVFGERLVFPASFVGRGDMSRGGLLLRSARTGDELEYTPVAGATRRGSRPPKLPKLPRLQGAAMIDSSAVRKGGGIGTAVRATRSTKT
jgi:hypothetical protein